MQVSKITEYLIIIKKYFFYSQMIQNLSYNNCTIEIFKIEKKY